MRTMSVAKAMSLAGILCAAASASAGEVPMMRSAGALAFGDGDVLFVGDSKAGIVHAFDFDAEDFDNQSEVFLGRMETSEGWTLVDHVDAEIAGLLGIHPYDVMINDMVVHPGSQQVFLSVHRGAGPDAEPVIVKVDQGSVSLVDLTNASYSKTSVGELPGSGGLEFGQDMRDLAITDIDFYEGEIFVAGVGTGDFASNLRRIAYPFTGEVATSSIEIWHAVHAQFETRAPIISQQIHEIDGVPTLVAVYACTPLVRIPLSALQDGAHVRGEMIGELGYGSTPIDMISYNDPMDQNDYVLITSTSRSAKRVSLADIGTVDAMPTEAPNNFGPAGINQFPMPTEAEHLAMLNPYWSVAVRRNVQDPRKLDLVSIPVPFFLDRAIHVVEMNFEGAADPFGFRNHERLKR